ncbi:type II toxin-antitoxin system VapB family antitoxin [Neorhizobium alkalisoli]|uniref:type II toxin-antitoxin system VapB family antitoxin n=1 Tax=Neorhizobium alkalisoli TaxID=528178 RepID=UPI000CF9028A|nr:type II toxin-antitoxin system VapB family antitoxin [Neorhizobium alkalisoli]
MTLNIRNEEADVLARELARIDGTTITDAVISALKETLSQRIRQETPRETARRILAKRGLSFKPDRRPLPSDAYHDLDHDLGSP